MSASRHCTPGVCRPGRRRATPSTSVMMPTVPHGRGPGWYVRRQQWRRRYGHGDSGPPRGNVRGRHDHAQAVSVLGGLLGQLGRGRLRRCTAVRPRHTAAQGDAAARAWQVVVQGDRKEALTRRRRGETGFRRLGFHDGVPIRPGLRRMRGGMFPCASDPDKCTTGHVGSHPVACARPRPGSPSARRAAADGDDVSAGKAGSSITEVPLSEGSLIKSIHATSRVAGGRPRDPSSPHRRSRGPAHS